MAPVNALPGTERFSVPGDKDDLPGCIAVAGMAVQQLSKSRFAMTPELLYASLAVYSLVYTVLSVVNDKVRPFLNFIFINLGMISNRAL